MGRIGVWMGFLGVPLINGGWIGVFDGTVYGDFWGFLKDLKWWVLNAHKILNF